MRDAAIVVLPYRRTDASGVLATAIGHGRPVAVTDVGCSARPSATSTLARSCRPATSARSPRRASALEPERLAAAFDGTRAARKALTWTRPRRHERVYEAIL
jgi:hypothetical protein